MLRFLRPFCLECSGSARQETPHISGCCAGTLAAAVHHGLTLPKGAVAGIKGGWLGLVNTYPSEMAQNFWAATIAWSACFIVTIIVSLCDQTTENQR